MPNNYHLESHEYLPSATEFSLGLWFCEPRCSGWLRSE